MRFRPTRVQLILTTLIIVCFFVCMILGIFVVSDMDGFRWRFRRETVIAQSETLVDLSSHQRLNRYVMNSSHSAVPERISSYAWNNKVTVVTAENTGIINKSASVYVSISEDILPNYDVHIFYYPWYGSPTYDGIYLHWNHRVLPHWKPEVSARYPVGRRYKPPDDVGSSFYPRLGPYSSRDPNVIADHMRQIRQSGAGVISVSWYPPGLADSEGRNVDSVMPLLLDAADKQQLKVCFHIEPYQDRNIASLRSNLSYIVSRYGNHSAFYRHPGSNLPIYYIYDSYLIPSDQWIALLCRNGDHGQDSVRGTALDGIFLGLIVDRTHVDQLIRCGFDGYYTYFASDRFSYGSTTSNWASLAARARQRGLLFVPSVGPGYIDVQIRPWNAANTRDRQQGAYFEHEFRAAIESRPNLITITSFNEWHEGTQIEEAVRKQTGNRRYSDYSPANTDFYLRLSHKWTLIYAQQKHRR